MPDDALLVTALILERPLCVRCIATKASLSLVALDAAIARVETVLVVHRATDRCSGCGNPDTVFFVDRPL